MRWGLVARSENRGLGIMAWEIQRNLTPDATLMIDMGVLGRGFPMHPDRFPGATVAPFVDGTLPEDVCRDWLAGLDVVLTLETAYDERFYGWAADAGCRTVCWSMPEFFRVGSAQPDAIWNPTAWRHETLPTGSRVVPVPVATDHYQVPDVRNPGPIRVLHNMGHRAAMDRNGTSTFLASLRLMRAGRSVEVTVSGQDGRLPTARGGRNVTVTNRVNGSDHYWDVPAGMDVIVLPRRYGGLCLPVQEAMAAGVVPVMPDCEPNTDWPVDTIRCRQDGVIDTPGGAVPLNLCDPGDVARAVDALVNDPDLLASRRGGVLAWAEWNSWQARSDQIMDELDRVAHPGV